MTNWRTSLVGIIAMLALIVKTLLGIEVPADVQAAFLVVIVFLMGLFARDAKAAEEDKGYAKR